MLHKRSRDFQRSKVYKSEALCWGNGVTKIHHNSVRTLETLPEMALYVLRILQNPELRKLYGAHLEDPIEVGDGRGTRRPYAFGTHKITIPKWARTNAIVIHEVAHVLNNRCHRLPSVNEYTARIHAADYSPHGAAYTRVYLDIVKAMMGEQASKDLRKSFDAAKVKVL
jgi:putative metallohydrolase (TIGR04338 family)